MTRRMLKFLGLTLAIVWAALAVPSVFVDASAEDGVIQRGWGRDPFVPIDFRQAAVTAKEKLAPAPKSESYWLTGVFYRRGRNLAIINRILVREGEEIFGMKVIKILPDRVLIEKEGEEIILRMGVG